MARHRRTKAQEGLGTTDLNGALQGIPETNGASAVAPGSPLTQKESMNRIEAIEHLLNCVDAADNDGYLDNGQGWEALLALGVTPAEYTEARQAMGMGTCTPPVLKEIRYQLDETGRWWKAQCPDCPAYHSLLAHNYQPIWKYQHYCTAEPRPEQHTEPILTEQDWLGNTGPARCHAQHNDGDCDWIHCPQISNRQSHCPLDTVPYGED